MLTFTLFKRRNWDGEYVVRAYKDGERYPAADYFTDDWDDAVNTKIAMEAQADKDDLSVEFP